MKKLNLNGDLSSLVAFLILIVLALPSPAQEMKVEQEFYGSAATEIVPGAKFVRMEVDSKFPSSVQFQTNKGVDVKDFEPWFRKTFGMSSENDFITIDIQRDELGYTHNKFSQSYKGITVDRAIYIIQSKDGRVTSFRGDVFDIPDMRVEPGLSEHEALDKALSHFEAENYLWKIDYWEQEIKDRLDDPYATYYPNAELVITKFGLNGEGMEIGEFRLAYAFDIHALELEEKIVIDAHTGQLLYTLPLASNCSPATVNTIFNGNQDIDTDKYTANDFRLRDDCEAAHVRVRDWNSATDVSNNPLEIENTTNTWTTMDERFGGTVLWEARQSYWYFKDEHSRSSYDGADGDIECYINAVFKRSNGTFYTDNASMSFSGSRMKIGLGSDGVLPNSWSSIDIVGHEFTHAVTGTSSGLVYQGESGALNESFSDIFGEMVENYTAGPNDWLMGDDRTDGAIRSMSDPRSMGDPDTYQDDNWASTCGTCSDNGGVHTNSGVQNHWFYLLSEGGSGTNEDGDSYDIDGIGRAQASAIAFRNMVLKLGPNSDYDDARAGAIEAAEDLYGLCSDQVKQVTNAWYAVGVGNPYVDVTLFSKSNVSCAGAGDGSIYLRQKGTPPYTYSWSHGLPGVDPQHNLSGGTYSVTVTDATGCSAELEITIDEPLPLEASITDESDYNGYGVSCNGGDDGWATVTAIEGTPPYSYEWSDGQTTATAVNLSAGNYTVTVTDANDCSTSTSTTLNEPPALTIEASDNQTVYYGYPPTECATVSWSGAGGGVPPYTIEWSDGGAQTHEVCPGEFTTVYTVTITDLNGCIETDEVVICVIDVRCGNNLNKVEICHAPEENPENVQTLCVGLNAVADHLFHGDMLAACGTDHNCPPAEAKTNHLSLDAKENQSGIHLNAYPNPFIESTTIDFFSAEAGNVTIQLFDNVGRMVYTLFDSEVEGGTKHQLFIDGTRLSSGVHICVLKHSNGTLLTKQLVLSR